MPSDKILFPRRMLYVEAVLYLVVALASFGLGYLFGRNGQPPATNPEDAAVARRVPVEGRVTLAPVGGKSRGDGGAVVIALPADFQSERRLSASALRPGGPVWQPQDPALQQLTEMGGAAVRAADDGGFTFFVPQAGDYRILVVSRQAARTSDGPMEQRDLDELGRYFDAPAELVQQYRFRWLSRQLRIGCKPIEVQFTD